MFFKFFDKFFRGRAARCIAAPRLGKNVSYGEGNPSGSARAEPPPFTQGRRFAGKGLAWVRRFWRAMRGAGVFSPSVGCRRQLPRQWKSRRQGAVNLVQCNTRDCGTAQWPSPTWVSGAQVFFYALLVSRLCRPLRRRRFATLKGAPLRGKGSARVQRGSASRQRFGQQ